MGGVSDADLLFRYNILRTGNIQSRSETAPTDFLGKTRQVAAPSPAITAGQFLGSPRRLEKPCGLTREHLEAPQSPPFEPALVSASPILQRHLGAPALVWAATSAANRD